MIVSVASDGPALVTRMRYVAGEPGVSSGSVVPSGNDLITDRSARLDVTGAAREVTVGVPGASTVAMLAKVPAATPAGTAAVIVIRARLPVRRRTGR